MQGTHQKAGKLSKKTRKEQNTPDTDQGTWSLGEKMFFLQLLSSSYQRREPL